MTMNVIIRLQNLPLTASAMDIRVFFHGLAIPDGGVHIVGGKHGDAFIAFSSDEDARQAMNLSGEKLKDCTIKLLLSSRNEMFKIIEEARLAVVAATNEDSAPIHSGGIVGNQQNQTPAIRSRSGEGVGVIHTPTPNNSLEATSSNLNLINNNALPNLNMAALAGFPTGLNMNLPNAMTPFQNMKLTPQQLTSFMSGAASMQGLFPQAPSTPTLAQSANAFMLPNMGLGGSGGQNPMLQSNPLAFSGILPGMLPHGMIQGMNMMNQPPAQPTPNPNTQQPIGNFQFNQNGNSMRMGGVNKMGGQHQNNSGFQNLPNPNIIQSRGQPNGASGQGRQNFNQDIDNFNRNRLNPNEDVKWGPPFRQNMNSDFEQNRERGLNQNRERGTLDQNRERDRGRDNREQVEELNKPNRIGRKRSLSAEKKDSRERDRRRRSRSRSRERERSRREGRKSKSRSRSRNRGDRLERPGSSGRRNSTRDTSLPDSDLRNELAAEHDLMIDEGDPVESACVMLYNVPSEASYRDVREFLRVDARRYGIMRDYEIGTACIRLDNPSELQKVLRNNGRKLIGEVVRVEVVPLQVFEDESKKHGAPIEYDREKDRSKVLGDRNRDRQRDFDSSERDKDRERDFRIRERERDPRDHDRDVGECCLVINGLPVNFNGADVANITLDGIIKTCYSDIHIHEEPADRHNRQFATAFVKFHSVVEAERAIALIAKTQGDHLRARVTNIEELEKIRQNVISPSPGRRGGNDSRSPFEIDAETDSVNVMLKGIPVNMSERDVFDFFSDIGLSPKRVKILSDAQTGNRIGKVICEFNDTTQSRRALAKDGQFFGRSIIAVHMLPRREDNKAPTRGRQTVWGNRPSFPPSNTRFPPGPQNQSENPFVQALNASSSVVIPPVDHSMRGNMRGGLRGRGIGRGRGGIRPSRFAPADSTTSDTNHNYENPTSLFDRKGCVVAVTNIPFSANMDQIIIFLEETFEKQVPHDRIIRRYNEFQKPTGDARIAFDSPFEAKKALEKLNGVRMWGRLLEVSILNDF